MADEIRIAQLSPGIYLDLDKPGLISIDPVQVLNAQDMDHDNMLEEAIFDTLRKQYVALGYSVALLTDMRPDDDADSIDQGEG